MKAIIILILCCFISIQCAAQDAVGLSASEIAEYPKPNVSPLVVDDAILYDRIYRKVESPLTIFNAPNGDVEKELGSGYNFVTLAGSGTQGDWTQIRSDQWIASAGLVESAPSRFTGVRIPKEGVRYPFAWLLRHIRASETPGGEESDNNPFLYRYTVVSIYDTVTVDGYNWYQIGENQWVHQFNVAKYLPIERPEETTDKWISVDLYEQVLIAYEDQQPVFATLISSGLPAWSTNEGLFNVYIRYERTLMSGAYNQPDFYYLEEVPWTMFFDGDIGLHGTYWHDGFGFRQSHGCVNMSIIDAKWVFDWSKDVRDPEDLESVDLSVYVYSSGQYE